jgi:L-malate glycosyltransferase
MSGAISVLYVIDSLNVGGTENQVMHMSLRLPPDRYRLTVCCLKAEGPLLEPLKQAGIRIVEFSPGSSLISMSGALQLLRLACFVRRERFQIVHAHDLWSNLMGVPAALIARTPVIISSQRNLAHLSWYSTWRKPVITALQRASEFVIANSSAICDMLEKDGLHRNNIRLIYNGVDFDRFAFTQADKRKLFPGLDNGRKLIAVIANMHSEVKGHSYLIDAAQGICQIFPETLFVLIGDGALRPELEQRVGGLGLKDNFLFLGSRRDVPELLCCCDLFVLPSTAEGLPNAVLEAMAAGLPVVATRVGGTGEIIEDGISGFLVEPKSSSALTEVIVRVLRNPEMAIRLALTGQERVRVKFSFDRVLEELEQLYRIGFVG